MYVTFFVAGQLFGLEIGRVREIFFPEAIFHVPMAPRQVAGLLNLRGRIVTVIDMRDKLSLIDVADDRNERRPSITTERDGELYSLWIDKVGDIIEVKSESMRPVPATVSSAWRQLAHSVCRLDGALMVILDIDALFADTALRAA
jgi:purine-binding chemotaxis protein CheW